LKTRRGSRPRASLHGRRRLKSVTSADWRDHQVQCRMSRMPAFLDQILRRFVLHANLCQLLVGLMLLAIVKAKAALTVVYLIHKDLHDK